MFASGIFRRWLARLPYGCVFDRIYIFTIFLYAHRRLPRRDTQLFNDYLYFLKTSQEIMDVFRQVTSDKVEVKNYVSRICGQDIVLPTFGVFEAINDINIAALPRPCVIKPAHGSGSIVFVKHGQLALGNEECHLLQEALETSPYISAREGNYRYLRPRLICEPMLPSGEETKDYKFFCYAGKPRIIQVDSERHSDHKRNLYDARWTPLSISYNYPIGEWEEAPVFLGRMSYIAEELAQYFDFVRVDFFLDKDKFYVGELTHCPESAHGRFRTIEEEMAFSELLFRCPART